MDAPAVVRFSSSSSSSDESDSLSEDEPEEEVGSSSSEKCAVEFWCVSLGFSFVALIMNQCAAYCAEVLELTALKWDAGCSCESWVGMPGEQVEFVSRGKRNE